MNRETYYWTCPYCKANLDPGERCDCQKEKDNTVVDSYKAVQVGGEKKNESGYEKQFIRLFG